MHAHARHLHLTALERMTFLPPLYKREQLSRAETIKLLLNPPQRWDSPMKTIASLACQLEECVDRKLKSWHPKILVVTDKMALDFKFDVAVMYVVARVQQADLAIGESTIVFYSELDTVPTRFASCWLSASKDELRYRNSAGFNLSSIEGIRVASALDRKWYWFRP